MAGAAAGDRYVVISADCHAGASMETYREYLDPTFRDEYDAWRAGVRRPVRGPADTAAQEYRRNYDSRVRQRDLEADGIVGEVVFPNTIPPFFSSCRSSAADPANGRGATAASWAGLHAHNRWLADFCNELPGAAGRGRADPARRRRRSARRDPSRQGGGCLRRHPAPHPGPWRRRCPTAARAVLRADLGAVRGPRACRSTCTVAAGSPTRASTRRSGAMIFMERWLVRLDRCTG